MKHGGAQALDQLVGLLEGVAIDQIVNEDELAGLAQWLVEHSDALARAPFDQVAQRVEAGLAKKFVSTSVSAELVEFAEWFRAEHGAENGTASLARLSGVCAGLLADGRLSDQEAIDLQEWFEDFDELRKLAPLAHLFETLDSALADGVLDEGERAALTTIIAGLRDGLLGDG